MHKLSILFIICLSLACAQAPTQELNTAQAAFEDLVNSKGMTPVVEIVQDSLKAAIKEIEAQNLKFALFRSYLRARTMLVKIPDQVEEARFSSRARNTETDVKMAKIMAINEIVDAAIAAIHEIEK